MAYRDFTFQDLEQKFGIRQRKKQLFKSNEIQAVVPSSWLLQTLEKSGLVAKSTEKAVSELVIMPVLWEILDINQSAISLFSGEDLPGDRSKGLNGEVDFIITNVPQSAELRAPIISITEAKLNKAIEKSTAQAAAQMTGAYYFNKKNGSEAAHIYGAVTNGSAWLFLKLEDNTLYLDTDEYGIINLPELLGVLQAVVNSFH